MNNQSMLAEPVAYPLPQDRLDLLLDEVHLAMQWQKPAYLMAVYHSPEVKIGAMNNIARQLQDAGLAIYSIDTEKTTFNEFIRIVFEDAEPEKKIYFIENLSLQADLAENDSWRMFYCQREGFDKRLLRVIFWLSESQLVQLATEFPVYWENRYRIFDLSNTSSAIEETAAKQDDLTQKNNRTDSDNNLSARLLIESRENLRLGILNWRNGDPDSACQYLQNAADLADVLGDAGLQSECQKALALTLTEMGNITEAIESYEKALMLQPDPSFPWNNLGNLYLRTNNFIKAQEAFKFALSHKQDDVVGWVGLANVYEKMNLPQEAIGAYRKALRIVPDFPQALLNVGGVLEKINRLDKAIKAYELLLAKDRKHATAWVRLAKIYHRQNQPEKAINTLRSGLQHLPRSFELWMNLGQCSEEHNNTIAAEAYRKALMINPCNGRAYCSLAQTQKMLGNPLEAISCYEIGINFLEDDDERAQAWNSLLSLLAEKESAGLTSRKEQEKSPALSQIPIDNPDREDKQIKQPGLIKTVDVPEILDDNLSLKNMNQAGMTTASVGGLAESSSLPTYAWQKPRQDPNLHQIDEWTGGMALSSVPVWFRNEKNLARELQVLKRTHCENRSEHDRIQLLMDARLEQPIADIWQPHKKHRSNPRKAEKFSMFPGKENPSLARSFTEAAGFSLKKLRGMGDHDEKGAQTWIRQGKHLLKRGFYNDALVAFASAINDAPGNATAYINMGITFFLQSKYEQALTQFTKGIELTRNPDEKALAWNYVGDTYRRLHDKENAMRAYQKVSELKNPRNSLRQRAQQVLVFGNC